MNKKITFSKQPLVAVHVSATNDPNPQPREAFIAEWRKDKSVQLRIFNRGVRAGGCSAGVIMVVVRRKVTEEQQ